MHLLREIRRGSARPRLANKTLHTIRVVALARPFAHVGRTSAPWHLADPRPSATAVPHVFVSQPERSGYGAWCIPPSRRVHDGTTDQRVRRGIADRSPDPVSKRLGPRVAHT